ncbi:unnamed protein product [Mytilus coruscus]|uniref:Uncharacterized protein n=1 Tax=Mytilus coruscus TaxID=42192 RepID=A0A6J8C356_MYTCO|nr:unnamed protein product [Mytilus coruscus]
MNILCDHRDYYYRKGNSDRRDKHERMIKLILEKVNHDCLDLQNVLNYACRCDLLEVLTLLLEKADHKNLDVKKAMNILCDHRDYYYGGGNSDRRDKHDRTIKLILEKVNHDCLDLQNVLDHACLFELVDVVTLLLEKTDHKKLDVKRATNILCDKGDYYDDEINTHERMIKLILEKVNHDCLDLQNILDYACRFELEDGVTLLLEKTDHKKLDVKKAMNIICDKWDYCYKEANSDRRDKHERMIKLILEKVNHDLLDLQNVLDHVCRYCLLDVVTLLLEKTDHNVVTLLLEKTDHKKLDVKKAMNIQCDHRDYYYGGGNSDRKDKHERTIKLILGKVNHDCLDLQNVLDHACLFELVDVVTLLLEKTDHKKLDVKRATNILCDKGDYYDDEINTHERMIKLILEKVNHDCLDLQNVLDHACLFELVDVVTLLLEKTDHKKLDVKRATNILCDKGDYYDDEINTHERMIKLIFEKVNHDCLDLQNVLDYACRFELEDGVTLLLEKTDHKKLDVKKAMNIICDEWDYCYKEGNSDRRDKHERMIKLILEKVNHDFLDLQNVFYHVCRYCLLDVVTLLLEKKQIIKS